MQIEGKAHVDFDLTLGTYLNKIMIRIIVKLSLSLNL